MNSRVKEDAQKIFEFWCEVTKAEKSQKTTGHVIESFPENYRDDNAINKIPDFAYPCDFENESVQSYSFVLTSDDSKWRFGFCRHDPKTQTAMVIITALPWHDTFLRLLTVLGELRRTKNGEFESFLAETYNKGIPDAGANLKLFYNGGQNHFIFQRPSQFQLPSIPENHNLNLYYNFIDPKNMIAVFAAMLSERRIIFNSRRLDKLSSCVQAANAFLYPMVWQHIFIPVLPMKLKDILSAPMPYIIGAPTAVLQTMTPEELGDVVILNCDSKTFESPFDDLRQMPSELVSQMKKLLSNSHDHIGDRVSKIFLGILVQLIGGYRDAVRFINGQKITWDRDLFVESRPHHLRPFIARIMELQIFQQFIEERLEMLNTGQGFSDEFELETLRQAEKLGKRGRNYKEFLKNVKDKTNPAVKSAVKSVKESSKGVYKDLKSKFRDVTPPSSQFHSHISTPIQHRSAPNSPVFEKRHISLNYSGGRKQLATSTSNSHFQPNNITQLSSPKHKALNQIHNNNNNNQNLTPTVSPSSSVCLSDMNLTQELQSHPLFKLPTVDRNLKPNSNLDLIPGNIPTGNLCNMDEVDENVEEQIENATINEIFDIPPDVQSPPVPPRQSKTSKNTVLSNNNSLFEITNADANELIGFENDFISNDNTLNATRHFNFPLNSIKNTQLQAPVPIPRQKLKDPSNSQKNVNITETKDLISLDDSNNTSFDIEDLDPLNQHAKPIPLLNLKKNNSRPSTPGTKSLSSMYLPNSTNGGTNQICSVTLPSVHNPIYPYFTPIHNRNAQGSSANVAKTDDFELLRKYGLDQFSLTTNNTLTPNSSNNQVTNMKIKDGKSWTTFE